ncbi:MAG: zinc-dependent alcohol dehydrogenase [Sphingomonadaceae bacterium]
MRAAVFTGIRKIEMQDAPTPTPRPNEVLIRVRVVGVCGSEVHAFLGTHPFRKPPAIMGHEVAGDIVEVGPEVAGFKEGDRVIVEPQIVCGSCLYCRTGSYNLCPSKVMLGVPAWPGGFGEYIVAPESTLLKMPEGFSYEEGAMVEPLAVGIHSARMAKLQLGDSALVLGSGPIGLCCIAAARASGATHIVATDTYDFNLELARKVGATAAVNVRKEDNLAQVVADHVRPEGVDVAFVTAGFSSVVQQGLIHVRKQGRVLLVALFDEPISLPDPFLIGGKEVELVGVHTYVRKDFEAAIDLIASGAVDVKAMVTHVLPVEEAQRALELVHGKTEDNAKVMLRF